MSISKNYQTFKEINLDLFYVVRLYPYGIDLQGECTKEIIRYCKEKFNAEFSLSENESWLTSKADIQGTIINITLTIK